MPWLTLALVLSSSVKSVDENEGMLPVPRSYQIERAGWLPVERAVALRHIARVVREDDGTGALARAFGGSYREVLAGALTVPASLRLPDAYRLDVGTYPNTSQGLSALVKNPGASNWNGPYLKKKDVPADPWDHAYKYTCCPGQHDEYDLWSEGSDGAPGGDGEAADVASWELARKKPQ